MSKPIEDAADIISQQNALIEELQAKLAAQAAPVVAASELTDERAAFEAWARKECGMPADMPFNWDAMWVDDAWTGWQARAALPVRESMSAIDVEQLQARLNALLNYPEGSVGAAMEAACFYSWREAHVNRPGWDDSDLFIYQKGLHDGRLASSQAAAPADSVAVPAGFDVAGLREELWRLSEHTETFGSCADAARIAFEGAIQALDEFAAAPATPAAQAQQPAGDGWIACADRMPAEADPVLVYVPGDPGLKIWIDTWQEQFDCPVAWSTAEVSIGPGWDDHEFEEVTHWMPLPLPPAPGLMEAE